MGALVEYIQNVERINGYNKADDEFYPIGDGKGKPLSLDPDDKNTKRLLACRAIVSKDDVAKTSQGAKVLNGEPVDPDGGTPPDPDADNSTGSDDVAVVPAKTDSLEAWQAFATNPNGGGLAASDVEGKSKTAIQKMLA